MPKVAKSGLKKAEVIHPNSRAANVLARKLHRSQHLDKHQKERSFKLEKLGEKLLWFRDHLDKDKASYIPADVCHLIELYLRRFDEELEQIEIVNGIKGRSGLQYVPRQTAIRMTLERERLEYETVGFEIPDITNCNNLNLLKSWTGELRYVQNIKLKRYLPVKPIPEPDRTLN